jgi:hypothetical protein
MIHSFAFALLIIYKTNEQTSIWCNHTIANTKNLRIIEGNTYRFKQYTSSSASGPTSRLYITAGFATTPPTPMKPEAGLRGRPAAEAPNKKIPHKM